MTASHGILNPRAGEAHFTLERFAPSPELAAFVERYWIVRWRLAAPFQQETLPHPTVNVVAGTHRTGVHGVPTRRFVADLAGTGFVIGAKLLPGGFFGFWRDDVVALTGRTLELVEAFGEPARALDPEMLAGLDDRGLVAAMERFLVERRPVRDAGAELATRIVQTVHGDPRLARTADLAARFDMSPRTLERLFRRYVGVSPKWVIRRYRVHEACERAKTGAGPDWAALAAELGYCDQAHFIRDFKAQVGRTPTEYAALCG